MEAVISALSRRRWRAALAAVVVSALVAALVVVFTSTSTSVERVVGGPTGAYVVPAGVHKIKHVIVIMQENRSFDSYFGTFPGADGIPVKNGKPTVCANDPLTGQCVKPYHNPQDLNGG